jgi:hypothetical protein
MGNYFIRAGSHVLATCIVFVHVRRAYGSIALNQTSKGRPPLKNYTLPENLNLDTTTMQRIQRQIDLGHQQDPAAVIAYAMMLLDIEEDWIGCPRTPAPEAPVLYH